MNRLKDIRKWYKREIHYRAVGASELPDQVFEDIGWLINWRNEMEKDDILWPTYKDGYDKGFKKAMLIAFKIYDKLHNNRDGYPTLFKDEFRKKEIEMPAGADTGKAS